MDFLEDIEPISAYKRATFHVRDGKTPYFKPLTHSTVYRLKDNANCVTGGHLSPSKACTCGFYATKTQEDLLRIPVAGLWTDSQEVTLKVKLYGTVIEAQNGYRAEKQEVEEIHLHGLCVDCGKLASKACVRKEQVLPICDLCPVSQEDKTISLNDLSKSINCPISLADEPSYTRAKAYCSNTSIGLFNVLYGNRLAFVPNAAASFVFFLTLLCAVFYFGANSNNDALMRYPLPGLSFESTGFILRKLGVKIILGSVLFLALFLTSSPIWRKNSIPDLTKNRVIKYVALLASTSVLVFFCAYTLVVETVRWSDATTPHASALVHSVIPDATAITYDQISSQIYTFKFKHNNTNCTMQLDGKKLEPVSCTIQSN